MNTEAQIKKMAKRFNNCSRCGCDNHDLDIGKDRKYDRVYVLCTNCGMNMNAENIDKLLTDWNADTFKEPGSEESLADENEKLKSRNEWLVAENERLYKKLEEYQDKRLAAENRRLKEIIEGLKEQCDRIWKMKTDVKNLDPDELLGVYDRMKGAAESRRLARRAEALKWDSPQDRIFEADCRTWDEKLAG